MADKDFKPGFSRAGAFDLTALQHQVKAEPGQAGGAPAAGGYVIEVSETNFESVVQSSATFPIVMLMWVPTDDRLFPMAQALGDAVNSMNGTALQHQVKAEPGQAGGAPAAGGYVIDVSETNFESVVQSSATFPIVMLMWVPTDDRLFPMAQALGDAVNSMNGQLQLARVDVAKNPAIAQAFGVQGAPALFALIGGRPMPILQGVPSNEELTQITAQVLPQLVQVAAQAGVTGTAPYIEPSDGDASAQQTEPQVPAAHAEAHRLAQSGDYAGAAAAYEQVHEADPSDTLAQRERAKALLLARSATADVREVREAAAANPDDVQAQLAVADVDMIGGQIQDAFSRLLDFAGTQRSALGRRRASRRCAGTACGGRRGYDRRADPGCVQPTARLRRHAPLRPRAGAPAPARVLPNPRSVRRALGRRAPPPLHPHVLMY